MEPKPKEPQQSPKNKLFEIASAMIKYKVPVLRKNKSDELINLIKARTVLPDEVLNLFKEKLTECSSKQEGVNNPSQCKSCWNIVNILYNISKFNTQILPKDLLFSLLAIVNKRHEPETCYSAISTLNLFIQQGKSRDISLELSDILINILNAYYLEPEEELQDGKEVKSILLSPLLESLMNEIRKQNLDENGVQNFLATRLRKEAVENLKNPLSNEFSKTFHEDFPVIKEFIAECKAESCEGFLARQEKETSWATIYELKALAVKYNFSVSVSQIGKEKEEFIVGENTTVLSIKLFQKTHWSFNEHTILDSNCLYNSLAQAILSKAKSLAYVPDTRQTKWFLENEIDFIVNRSKLIFSGLDCLLKMSVRCEPFSEKLLPFLEKVLDNSDSKCCSKILSIISEISKSDKITLSASTLQKILFFACEHSMPKVRSVAINILDKTLPSLINSDQEPKEATKMLKYSLYQGQNLPSDLLGYLIEKLDMLSEDKICEKGAIIESFGWILKNDHELSHAVFPKLEYLFKGKNIFINEKICFVLSYMQKYHWNTFHKPAELISSLVEAFTSKETPFKLKGYAKKIIIKALEAGFSIPNSTVIFDLKNYQQFAHEEFILFDLLPEPIEQSLMKEIEEMILGLYAGPKRASVSRSKILHIFAKKKKEFSQILLGKVEFCLLEGNDQEEVKSIILALCEVTSHTLSLREETLRSLKSVLTRILTKVKQNNSTNLKEIISLLDVIMRCLARGIPEFEACLKKDIWIEIVNEIEKATITSEKSSQLMTEETNNIYLIQTALTFWKQYAKKDWKLTKTTFQYLEKVLKENYLQDEELFILSAKAISSSLILEPANMSATILNIIKCRVEEKQFLPKKLIEAFINWLNLQKQIQGNTLAEVLSIFKNLSWDFRLIESSTEKLASLIFNENSQINEGVCELFKSMAENQVPISYRVIEILVQNFKRNPSTKIIEILVETFAFYSSYCNENETLKQILPCLEQRVQNIQDNIKEKPWLALLETVKKTNQSVSENLVKALAYITENKQVNSTTASYAAESVQRIQDNIKEKSCLALLEIVKKTKQSVSENIVEVLVHITENKQVNSVTASYAAEIVGFSLSFLQGEQDKIDKILQIITRRGILDNVERIEEKLFILLKVSEKGMRINKELISVLNSILIGNYKGNIKSKAALTIAFQVARLNLHELQINSFERCVCVDNEQEVQEGLWFIFSELAKKGYKPTPQVFEKCEKTLTSKAKSLQGVDFVIEFLRNSVLNSPQEVLSILMKVLAEPNPTIKKDIVEILSILIEAQLQIEFPLEMINIMKKLLQTNEEEEEDEEEIETKWLLISGLWFIAAKQNDDKKMIESLQSLKKCCEYEEFDFIPSDKFLESLLTILKNSPEKENISILIIDILNFLCNKAPLRIKKDIGTIYKLYLAGNITNMTLLEKSLILFEQIPSEEIQAPTDQKELEKLIELFSLNKNSSILFSIIQMILKFGEKGIRFSSSVLGFLANLLQDPASYNLISRAIFVILLEDNSHISSSNKEFMKIIQNTKELLEKSQNTIANFVIWYLGIVYQINKSLLPKELIMILEEVLEDYDLNWSIHWSSYQNNTAIRCYDKKLKNIELKSEEKYEILLNKGFALYQKNLYKDAIKCFDEALKLSELNSNLQLSSVLAYKGEAYRKMKTFDEALLFFNKSLEQKKDYIFARIKKALLHVQLGQYDTARENYEILQGIHLENYQQIENFHNFLIKLDYPKEKITKHICEIVTKLDNCSPEMLNYYLKILTMCDIYNSDLIEDLPIEDWTKSWLIYALVSLVEQGKDDISLDEFNSNLIALDNVHKFSRLDIRRDNLLIALFLKQFQFRWSLSELNEILLLSQEDLSHVMDILTSADIKEEDLIKKRLLSDRMKTILANETKDDYKGEEIIKILQKSNLNWNISMFQGLLNRLSKPINSTQLYNFVNKLQVNQISYQEFLFCTQSVQAETGKELVAFDKALEFFILTREIKDIFDKEDEKRNEEMQEQIFKLWDTESQKEEVTICSFKFQAKWSFDQIFELISAIKQRTKTNKISSREIINVIYLINTFALELSNKDCDNKNLIAIINEKPPHEWIASLHNICITKYFRNAKVAEWDELIDELKNLSLNQRYNDVFRLLENPKLYQNYQTICLYEERDSQFFPQNLPIKSWKQKDVKSWAKSFRKAPKPEAILEMIAIIVRAVELKFGYKPRMVQLLTVLILLEGTQEKGRLAQVLTGEGKTITIAMLAVVKVLFGNIVDVVTTSPILAERDTEETKEFYSYLSISVSHNKTPENYVEGEKYCYRSDIVYGNNEEFEADVLRTDYSLLNTRGKRKFGVVIVDEVDSMLIDQSGDSTRLVGNMPGMDHLIPFLAMVWHKVKAMQASLIPLGEKTFRIDPNFEKGDNILDAVMQLLPNEIKTTYNVVDIEKLKEKIQETINASKSDNEKYKHIRKEIAEMLRSGEEDEQFSDSFKAKMQEVENRELINEDDEIVSTYLEDLYNSQAGQLKILGDQFNVHFNVYKTEKGVGIVVDDRFIDNEEEIGTGAPLKDNPIILTIFILEGKYYPVHEIDVEKELINSLKSQIKSSAEIKINLSQQPQQGNGSNSPQISIEDSKIEIPVHLVQLAHSSLEEWIKSAFEAMVYQEDKNYIIKKDENGVARIVPVDFSNTGIVQGRVQWGNGLHQFLQMKHSLKVTPENLSTNFLSNMAFFRKYKANIFGMTGTLGSEAEQNLLAEIYNVDLVQIPPYKQKQMLRLVDILAESQEKWIEAICNACIMESTKGRAILVICETIHKALAISERMNKKSNSSIKVKFYTRDDTEEKNTANEILVSGDIVVATNLAGRGTNFKLHQSVVDKGGLHICLTFLPSNLRVEEQAIGRASRKGQPGTAQLVLCHMDILATLQERSGALIEGNTINDLKEWRNRIEQQSVGEMKENQCKKILLEDSLFQQFCELLNSIRNKYDVSYKEKAKPVLTAIEERWGIFLKVNMKGSGTELSAKEPEIRQKFKAFVDKINEDFSKGRVILNPYYYIQIGNNHLDDEEWDFAYMNYTKAIELDPVFSVNALYNRAFALVKKADEGYKEKSVEDLQKTYFILCSYMKPLWLITSMLIGSADKDGKPIDISDKSKLKKEPDDELTKQLLNKVDLLNIYADCAEKSIENIQKFDEMIAIMWAIEAFFENGKPLPKEEVLGLYGNGMCGFYKIEEKPLPWLSIIAVFIIAAVQVIGGALLTPFAPNIGMGLIGEGVGDIMFAVQCIKQGSFSWKEYGKQKLISMAISLATGAVCAVASKIATVIGKGVGLLRGAISSTKGLSTGMKWASQAFKTVKNFVVKGYKVVKNMALKAKNFIKNKWTAFKNLKYVAKARSIYIRAFTWLKTQGKRLWNGVKRLTGRGMNTQIKKGVIPGYVKQGWKLGLKKAGLELGKGFVSMGLNYLLDKVLVDKIIKAINDEINKKVCESMKVEVKKKKEQILRILSLAQNEAEAVSKIKFAGDEILNPNQQSSFLQTVGSIATQVTKSVLKNTEIKEELKKAKLNSVAILLKVTAITITIVEKSVVLSEIVNLSNAFYTKLQGKLDDIEQKYTNNNAQVNKKVSTNYEKFETDLVDRWSKAVANKMAQMIGNEFIQPVTGLSVNFLCQKLFEKQDKKFNDQLKIYKTDLQFEELGKKAKNNTKAQKQDAEVSDRHLEQHLDNAIDVMKGGKGSIHHLGAIQDTYGVNVDLYVQDKNGQIKHRRSYNSTDNANGTISLMYIPPCKEHPNGHYQMLTSDGRGGLQPSNAIKTNNIGANDCLFAIVAYNRFGGDYNPANIAAVRKNIADHHLNNTGAYLNNRQYTRVLDRMRTEGEEFRKTYRGATGGDHELRRDRRLYLDDHEAGMEFMRRVEDIRHQMKSANGRANVSLSAAGVVSVLRTEGGERFIATSGSDKDMHFWDDGSGTISFSNADGRDNRKATRPQGVNDDYNWDREKRWNWDNHLQRETKMTVRQVWDQSGLPNERGRNEPRHPINCGEPRAMTLAYEASERNQRQDNVYSMSTFSRTISINPNSGREFLAPRERCENCATYVTGRIFTDPNYQDRFMNLDSVVETWNEGSGSSW